MSEPRYAKIMSARRRAVAAALAVVAASLVAAFTLQAAVSDGPDLQAMALVPGDFAGGAAVASQGSVAAAPPAVAGYARSFRPGALLAGHRLLTAENSVFAFGDAATATSQLDAVRAALATSAGRRAVGKEFASGFKQGVRGRVKLRSIAVGRPVGMRLGQSAFRFAIVLRTSLGRIEVGLAFVRMDQAIGVIALSAFPRARLTGAPVMLAAARLAQHSQAAFTIRNVAPPTIVGTPQLGQTLTADPGRWAGAPAGFSYQWNRCDAAGANCTPVSGAIAQTYVLGSPDSASRMTVTVKAENSVSSSALASSPTAPIT
jgi:hypothetical protein